MAQGQLRRRNGFHELHDGNLTQEKIGKFGVDKYGQQLFIPDADKTDADLGIYVFDTRGERHGNSLSK